MDQVGQTGKEFPRAADESVGTRAFGSLSPQQVNVYEMLKGFASITDPFHDYYCGAIHALEFKLPDYLAQAAHSIRELTDRLPGRIANLPRFDSPLTPVKALESELMKVKVNGYKDGWFGKAITKSLS